jgi:PAS domain S-box-containing protein
MALLDLHFLALTKAEKKILFAVLSILTGLCTIAFIAHRNSQSLIKSAESIEYAEEIKYHINEVYSLSLQMESGVRGYVMSGDESYMLPANEIVSNMFSHLHEASLIPGLSATQNDQIKQLRVLVDEKATLSTRIAEMRRLKGQADAMSFLQAGRDKVLMEEIRTISRDLIDKDEAHLAELKVKNKNVIRNFALTFYGLAAKISITVITVIVLFMLYLRQRNKAEKQLKANQELFQNVLDHTSAIISIKDLSGRYMLINKAYGHFLQTPKDTVKGNTVFDLFDKKIAEPMRDSDLEVVRRQEQIKVDEVAPYDGELRHFQSIKFPLFDSNKLPYAICTISTDETDRTRADEQHRKEMHRVMDLFNNAPCGYQSSNRDGIIIEINETLLTWLGYKRHEIVGKMAVRNLLSPDSIHQFTYYFPRLRSGEIKSIFDVQVTYIRKDGTKMPIIANTVATYDEDGSFLYTRTSVFDVSYRKRVEEIATSN